MKYVLHIVQAGEGCDYTIGCGHDVVELEADNKADALVEVRGELEHYGLAKSEDIERATLYAVHSEDDVPYEAWFDEDVAEDASKAQADKEVADRSELARLRGLYG